MIHSRLRKQLAVFVDRPRRKLAYVRGWATETGRRAFRPGGCESSLCKDPPGGHRDSGGPPAAGISLKNHSLKSDEKPLSILPNHLLRRHTQRLVELLPKRPDKRLLQELIHSNPLAPPLLKGASTNIPAV